MSVRSVNPALPSLPSGAAFLLGSPPVEPGPPLTPNHARLREIGLALPDAYETVQLYDHVVFKVGRKTFLWLDDSGEHITLKADPAAREVLLQDPRFEVAAYIGRYGWLGFAMGPEPDWSEVEDLIVDSYRLSALKRQLQALDAGA